MSEAKSEKRPKEETGQSHMKGKLKKYQGHPCVSSNTEIHGGVMITMHG